MILTLGTWVAQYAGHIRLLLNQGLSPVWGSLLHGESASPAPPPTRSLTLSLK